MNKPWVVNFLAVRESRRQCWCAFIEAAETAKEAIEKAEKMISESYPVHFIWDLTMLDPDDLPSKTIYPDSVMDPEDFEEDIWEELECRKS